MLPDFRVRQRDYLLEITRALTQELDLDSVLERILKFSIELLAGQSGLIVLRGESGGWDIRVSQGISPIFLQQLNPLLNAIPDNEDPQQFEIPEINRILSDLTFAARLRLLSGVGLPMVTQQKVLGVVFIFRGYPGIFSANDRALLGSFANQAAIAVQNAQLYTKVTLNKQHLDAILDSAADGILILTSNQVIERCNAHGVVPGIQTRGIAMAKMWAERGMRFVGVAAEHVFLLEKCKEAIATLRAAK